MLKGYKIISKIWTDFPCELEKSILKPDVDKLKDEIEKKRLFFEDFFIKIIVIGDMSNGKSTLINALLEREIFGTTAAHGTASFFYCFETLKDYEYFTINNTHEIKNIDLLRSSVEQINKLEGYFTENSVVRVYINDNKNEFFRFKTVIVDCPGLEKKVEYDKKIREHCNNADMFLFVFDIANPATEKHKKYIGEILKTFRKPACFFVYNKCDKISLDEYAMENVREQFFDGFESKYATDFKLEGDPLYFISAKQEFQKVFSKQLKGGKVKSSSETFDQKDKTNFYDTNEIYEKEFERLKMDIMTRKDVSYIRIQNVFAEVTVKIKEYLKRISETIKSVKETKNRFETNSKAANTEASDTKINCDNIRKNVRSAKEESIARIKNKDITKLINDTIGSSSGECYKGDYKDYVKKLTSEIQDEIIKFVRNNFNEFWYRPIERKLKEHPKLRDMISNGDFTLNFGISIPKNLNIEFSSFTWGEKTNEVKEKFMKYLSNQGIKNDIITNYEEKLATFSNKIENRLEKIMEEKHSETSTASTKLGEQNKLVDILLLYEKTVGKCYSDYQSLL